MTKNEAIENIKSRIKFDNDKCIEDCPFHRIELCLFTDEDVITYQCTYERTETCKALFKED